MDLQTANAFGRTVSLTYAETVIKVRKELQKEGFELISEIDVKKLYEKKSMGEHCDYLILGAFHPDLAIAGLNQEIYFGTSVSNNIVIYSRNDGKCTVMIADPTATLFMVDNPNITALAKQAASKMWRLLAAL